MTKDPTPLHAMTPLHATILRELTTASFVAVNDQFEDSTQSLVTQKECPL
jgi:hypothetical protein